MTITVCAARCHDMGARRGEGGTSQAYTHPPGLPKKKMQNQRNEKNIQNINNKNKSKEKSTQNTLVQSVIITPDGLNIF